MYASFSPLFNTVGVFCASNQSRSVGVTEVCAEVSAIALNDSRQRSMSTAPSLTSLRVRTLSTPLAIGRASAVSCNDDESTLYFIQPNRFQNPLPNNQSLFCLVS